MTLELQWKKGNRFEFVNFGKNRSSLAQLQRAYLFTEEKKIVEGLGICEAYKTLLLQYFC